MEGEFWTLQNRHRDRVRVAEKHAEWVRAGHDVGNGCRCPDRSPVSRWAIQTHWPGSCCLRRAATRLRQGSTDPPRWQTLIPPLHQTSQRSPRVPPSGSLQTPSVSRSTCDVQRGVRRPRPGAAPSHDTLHHDSCAATPPPRWLTRSASYCVPGAVLLCAASFVLLYQVVLSSERSALRTPNLAAVLGGSGRVSWQASARPHWCPAGRGQTALLFPESCCARNSRSPI